ncbi:MAG: alkaline shock response membrane anchor protein AmaP [Opitutales bacterium]|nr:alkaline shock response membrane anchor protein AmaP [Opitutales bacterium]NRA27036.1 alkaline shock response membrane anchor protein AmaP [Opitutales bacterium]
MIKQIEAYFQAFWSEPYAPYLGFGISLLLAIFLVAFIMRPRKVKVIVAFEDGSGSVSISRSAINELVQSACAQIDTIKQPKVFTKVKKGIPTLKIKLKVDGDVKMREVREELRETLQAQLMDNLGFRKIGDIDILVTSVGGITVQRPYGHGATNPSVEEEFSDSTDTISSSSFASSERSVGSDLERDDALGFDADAIKDDKKA